MKQIIELVHEVLDQEPMSAEEKLQLKKICELEDAFTKEFSKAKWREYFNIDLEKSALSCIEIDKAIEITYKLCKKTVWMIDLNCYSYLNLILLIYLTKIKQKRS